MDEKITEGLPTASFVPLAKYQFKTMPGMASVSVPVRGSFPDDGPFEGAYDICPEPGVILFGTLTQAMLAFKRYPALDKNQRFVISGLELNGSDLVVLGRVVELVGEVNNAVK